MYGLDVLHVSFTLPLLILSIYQLLPLCSVSSIVRLFILPLFPLLLMQNLSTPVAGAGKFLLGVFLEPKSAIPLPIPALIRKNYVRWTIFKVLPTMWLADAVPVEAFYQQHCTCKKSCLWALSELTDTKKLFLSWDVFKTRQLCNSSNPDATYLSRMHVQRSNMWGCRFGWLFPGSQH